MPEKLAGIVGSAQAAANLRKLCPDLEAEAATLEVKKLEPIALQPGELAAPAQH